MSINNKALVYKQWNLVKFVQESWRLWLLLFRKRKKHRRNQAFYFKERDLEQLKANVVQFDRSIH